MNRYYFEDIDGNEVDLEDSLYFMYDRLEVMAILFDYGMNKCFTNPLRSVLCEYIHSLHDCSFELVRSFHIDQPSRQKAAGVTAATDGE